MADDTTDDAQQDTNDEDDQQVTATWHTASSGPDREEMVSEYLPERADWPAKTVLDVNDPARVAALKNVDKLFPEVEHHQEIIDDFLQGFLKSRTSVHGQSRHQFTDILMSMFGGKPKDETGSILADALAADLDEED